MKANAVSLMAIFAEKIRLEVPLFQRQYVWKLEEQWEPLWEDISRKFSEYLSGRRDSPVHFLGAVVLDQKQTPTTHVPRRQVIDGQQRLTTLQLFVAAFRDYCRASDCLEIASECETLTFNKGLMSDPATDRFKVWPTQLDRTYFCDVVGAGSRSAVEAKYPPVKKKYSSKLVDRPRIVEAYLFFYNQIVEFFAESEVGPEDGARLKLESRLDECLQALKNALFVVAIDLEGGDDAQVIFETLNARGEPLLPADLLRNYIFLRASRVGENPEELYDKYWRRFDDPFWREEVKQGRLKRPRSDLFMQHFLASKQTADIPIRHLYVEYKYWIERGHPYENIREELSALAENGDWFRRIVAPRRDDVLFDLMSFLDAYDIRTVYPLLLAIFAARTSDDEWRAISTVLESYLLRRAVCNWTTKNYNKVFLGLTKAVQKGDATAQTIAARLLENSGEAAGWPTDAQFGEAWANQHSYQALNNPKLVHVLRRLNETYRTDKMEPLVFTGQLTVEHIMPQKWFEHWPLPDGELGVSPWSPVNTAVPPERIVASRSRDRVVQTLGNLTIITQALNSAVSNGPWAAKREAIAADCLLPLNKVVASPVAWDESAIAERSQDLFARALHLWSRPG